MLATALPITKQKSQDCLCAPYLNWSLTLKFRSRMADGLFLFYSPDLNKIGLWLNGKKKSWRGPQGSGAWAPLQEATRERAMSLRPSALIIFAERAFLGCSRSSINSALIKQNSGNLSAISKLRPSPLWYVNSPVALNWPGGCLWQTLKHPQDPESSWSSQEPPWFCFSGRNSQAPWKHSRRPSIKKRPFLCELFKSRS